MEGRTNLDGKSLMEERRNKEMLNTKQRFLSVNLYNHACASAALLFSGL